jgi:decaprenylphospho-beta-D-ribofuranose 2-oxidase
MKLYGWGRFPVVDARLRAPRSEEALITLVGEGQAIARGNGRSYGDSAISLHNTIHMVHFDRILSFDNNNGLLVAEAGVLIADVISTFLPQGWFLYVTPGTKFVTLGGIIAADVHGKNHHNDGSLRNYVEWLDIVDCNGGIRRCSREENHDLFDWTLGGMGLTGIILRAAIRMRRVETAWIRQTAIAARNFEHTMDILESNQAATYSVAWIDCLLRGDTAGRAIILLGEHASCDELPPMGEVSPLDLPSRKTVRVPFYFPGWMLNRRTMLMFNEFYYRTGMRKQGLVDLESYFYPLDALLDWNRIYGRRGFVQFQCVIPDDMARAGLREVLTTVSESGDGSFLAVLKKLGPSSAGISFPMAGFTLALDFAVRESTFSLIRDLERIAIECGGRIYLAKDACMTADRLDASDERIANFRRIRESSGARHAFQSMQSQRLSM